MHVLATAGHVDHGKSTLVRALTGMEPDRWAEEQLRGMTLDLGFAWTTLPCGQVVAFVDVPGHARYVPNMLAGVGPVPAALIVVAADEGWMPQSAEHLAALNAFGVRYGLLVVTRADLADPQPAAEQALAQIARTSLGKVEAVAVSAVTGAGMDELHARLSRLVARLPEPDRSAPVRLWIDRAFSIRGAGTVVTGTLREGRIRTGDELELASTGELVRVRALQSLGEPVTYAGAVARVAVNLRGVDRDRVRRGNALLTPGRFQRTDLADIRLDGPPVEDLPRDLMLHIGSAAVAVHLRPLGPDIVRLRLSRPLPLHIGDRALLRDPGRRDVVSGITFVDVAPPPLRGRGAAAARAAVLANASGNPDEHEQLRRLGLARRRDLQRMGVSVASAPVVGDWVADPDHWAHLRRRLQEEVRRRARDNPLEMGVPVEALRQALDLPDRALIDALVTPPLVSRAGRVNDEAARLPDKLTRAVERLHADLAAHPFQAPSLGRLTELGLGPREIRAAVRAGLLIYLADNLVLLPDAVEKAVQVLKELPQPFTASQARVALDTNRRVVVPLLERLDQNGFTKRHPDGRRTMALPGD